MFHRNFCIERFSEKEGGEGVSVTIFRQNGFCLTVSNHFVEETFCVSESFGFRKLLGTREGAGITIFLIPLGGWSSE